MGAISPLRGIKLSAEHIEKMVAAKIGIPQTLENKIKNREGQYRRLRKINPNYKVMGRNKRIKENGGFHTNNEWYEVKKKFNFTCPCCKRKEPKIKLTRDHIVPLLLKGLNDIKNIQPLCQNCNSRKHTQTIKYQSINWVQM